MTLSGAIVRQLVKSDLVRLKSTFRLGRINLMKAACPLEVQAEFGNQAASMPLVIVKNRQGFGHVLSTGYVPGAIMIAGAVRRNYLADEGRIHDYAWIEAGALDIQADDEISSQELMDKLTDLLNARILGPGKTALPGQACPWLCLVYPFENYFIYTYNGQKYRQNYLLDSVARTVKLSGGSVAVKEMFINATDAKMSMPIADTGARYYSSPTMGNTQSMTQGARNSELIHSIVRNWADVNESVRMYLAAIKHGNKQPIRPKFSPAPSDLIEWANMKAIVSMLASYGLTMYDYARWSLDAKTSKTKSHGGEDVPMSKHAYVGNPTDPSTWKLPIDTPGRARNALARINQTHGIPAEKKAGVLQKIRRAAGHHGIDVSDKPTGKQKSWIHKGKKQAASNVVGFKGAQVEEQEMAKALREQLRTSNGHFYGTPAGGV